MLVDQIGSAYSNDFNPSAVGSNVTSSSQQLNGGQYQQPPVQQPLEGQALDPQTQPTTGGQVHVPPVAWGQGQGQVTRGNHQLSNLQVPLLLR